MSKVVHLLVVLMVGLVWVGNVSAKEDTTKKKGNTEKPRQTAEQRFQKLDANSDGSLSLDEFKAGPRRNKTAGLAEALFKIKDKNADQKLTLDEFKTRNPEELLVQYDKNKDGEVTLEEFKAAQPGRNAGEKAEARFKKMDRNGDGKLTKDDVGRARKAGKKGGRKKAGKKAK